MKRFCYVFLLLFLATCSRAASPYKEPVTFSLTNNVGVGNSVFVVGNHPDLGNWDVTHAVKLRFTAGNVWAGDIAVQAGTQLQYKFIKRANAAGSWCSTTNTTDLTGVLTRSIPAQPAAPYDGKTIYYLSGWPSAVFSYNNGGTWTDLPMTKVGLGRSAAESLFKITGLGTAGEPIEFVFTDGKGGYDNPPGGGNYLTNLDILEVQDGNVYTYTPPPAVSPPQIVTHTVGSSVSGIAARTVRIYLPRGYAQNTTKRYPVLYLHDGQNVFDPGGPFGSWSADATATREIGRGRMRETIIVGVDNTNNRIPEYQPPNDSYQGTQGRADAYANFLINNVRPYIDTTYRTLNDPKNTLTIGSSMGGLVSLYLGREFTTFGRIGVMSPALWISPNYIAQVTGGSKKPLRVYLDMGTGEPADDFENCVEMYDAHLAQSYAANSEVLFVAGCGQQHNEAAWKQRLPAALDYLLPVREEPNQIAERDLPARFAIGSIDVTGRKAAFNYTGFFGYVYTLERSTNLTKWDAVYTSPPEQMPWASHVATDPLFPDGQWFWRLRSTAAP